MSLERSARPAGAGDEEFLFRLYVSTRAAEMAAFGWPPEQQEIFLRMQYRARTGGYSATYPNAGHTILLEAGAPVGAMIVNRDSKEVRLVDIAFLTEHRNHGYGQREVSNLIRQAAALALPLRLSVRRENPAVRLYQRLGFIPISEDAMYIEMEYPAGEDIGNRPSA